MKSVVAFPSSEFKSVTRCEVVALEHRIQGSENKLSILRTTASREFAKEHSALLCRSVRARKDDEEQRLEHIYRIAHIVRFGLGPRKLPNQTDRLVERRRIVGKGPKEFYQLGTVYVLSEEIGTTIGCGLTDLSVAPGLTGATLSK